MASIQILDSKLTFADNHSERSGAPSGIVLHHAASDGSVEDIHRYHKDVNHWAGIGYHFYVRKDGRIYRGRPESWLGAHTSGHNDKLGICVEGNFEKEYMSSEQQEAVTALVAYLQVQYGALTVYAHRDLDATACPGQYYPFEAIASGRVSGEDPILAFQQAALSDGIALPKYGADGIWGAETATAAKALVASGSRGERVKLIQRLLGGLTTDGIYGAKTLAAVKGFQAKNGLTVDGIVGIQTWKALLGVTA